MNNVK